MPDDGFFRDAQPVERHPVRSRRERRSWVDMRLPSPKIVATMLAVLFVGSGAVVLGGRENTPRPVRHEVAIPERVVAAPKPPVTPAVAAPMATERPERAKPSRARKAPQRASKRPRRARRARVVRRLPVVPARRPASRPVAQPQRRVVRPVVRSAPVIRQPVPVIRRAAPVQRPPSCTFPPC
jgi:hypothetical protein